MTVTTIHDDGRAPIAKPLLTPEQMGRALTLFGLPDVSGIALRGDPTPQDLAELVVDLDERLAHAQAVFAELTAALREMRTIAAEQIEREIVAAGGRAVPHETLEIELNERYERMRDVATLRADLEGHVPASEYARAVFVKSVDTKNANPAVVAALLENGGEAKWEVDLRALDKMARQYGGAIAETIERATRKVPVGKPSLVIRRREPALKLVGGAR